VWIAYEWLFDNEYEESRAALLRWVRARGAAGATKTQLARAFRAVKMRDRQDILEHLLEAGEIAIETKRSGGRPRTTYRESRWRRTRVRGGVMRAAAGGVRSIG